MVLCQRHRYFKGILISPLKTQETPVNLSSNVSAKGAPSFSLIETYFPAGNPWGPPFRSSARDLIIAF
jgi:hypothetical protein